MILNIFRNILLILKKKVRCIKVASRGGEGKGDEEIYGLYSAECIPINGRVPMQEMEYTNASCTFYSHTYTHTKLYISLKEEAFLHKETTIHSFYLSK